VAGLQEGLSALRGRRRHGETVRCRSLVQSDGPPVGSVGGGDDEQRIVEQCAETDATG
jgi:hypothetical protein